MGLRPLPSLLVHPQFSGGDRGFENLQAILIIGPEALGGFINLDMLSPRGEDLCFIPLVGREEDGGPEVFGDVGWRKGEGFVILARSFSGKG
jgi:hypothetical protein